jgi:hypothetical protein
MQEIVMRIVSDTADTASEEQFKNFFKQSVGFVGAIVAGTPVITGYLELIPPPFKEVPAGKAISILTMAISAALFLSLFWFRDRLTGMKAMRYSWAAIALGAGVLVYYVTVRQRLQDLPAPNGDGAFLKSHIELVALMYFVGFTAILGGVSGVFVCGFIQTRARFHSLTDLLPQLEPHQWQDLRDFARTLVSLNNEAQDKKIKLESKVALQKSRAHILDEYKRVLGQLEGGTLEIRGPAMDELYQYFLDGVQDSFKAVSYDDVDYWTDKAASDRYFAANKRLILDRKKTVERVFILNPARRLTEDNLRAIAKQIDIGVRVRIALLDNVRDLGRLEDLDFGLFDAFAVSSWRFSDHKSRLFQVLTSRRDIDKHERLFRDVIRRCEQLSGATDPTLFKDEQSLRAWAERTLPAPGHKRVRDGGTPRRSQPLNEVTTGGPVLIRRGNGGSDPFAEGG